MDERNTDMLTRTIIAAAIEVHRELGPGLLEAVYERALCIELRNLALAFQRQVRAPVMYRGTIVGNFRADLVVEGNVVLEIKSVEQLLGVHQAQLLAYMRVLKLSRGLLLNFYGEVLRTGIRRLSI